MTRYLPPETEKQIQELWKKQVPVRDIARQLDLPPHIIYYRTRLRDKADEEGFTSPAKRRKASIDKKHGSKSAYLLYLAREKGLPSIQKYREFLEEFRPEDYGKRKAEETAKRKGFLSVAEYRDDLQEKREKLPRNQALSYIMNERLGNGDTTILAKRLGKDRTTVIRYKNGQIFPSKENLDTILEFITFSRKEFEQLTLEMRLKGNGNTLPW